MNQARSRAIDRRRFESRKKRSNGGDVQSLAELAAEALRAALAALTPDERQAIETTFFAGFSHAEGHGAAESAARDHQDAHSFRTAQAAHALTAKIGGSRTPRKVYDAADQLSALLFRLTTPRTNPNTGI